MANYKCCFVVNCKSTTIETPHKLFFRVPTDSKLKAKWFKSAGRKDVPKSGRRSDYCCEDHFTLQDDMENYIKFKLVGARLQIKKGVLPHIFDGHDRQTDKTPPASHPDYDKLNSKRAVAQILSDSKEQPVEILIIDSDEETVDPTKRNYCDGVVEVQDSQGIPLDPSLTVVIEDGFSDNITSNNKKTTHAVPQSLIDKQPFTCPVFITKQEPVESNSHQTPDCDQYDETGTPQASSLPINLGCTYGITQQDFAFKVEPKQERSDICDASTAFTAYAYALWTPNQEFEAVTSTSVENKQEHKNTADRFTTNEDHVITTENDSGNQEIKKEVESDNASSGDKNNGNEYCLMNYRNSIVIHVKLNGSSIDEIFKCAKCECTSRVQHDLLRHIRMFHDADAVAYNCTECTYTTTWKHYLRDHYRIEHHASDQLQECPQCNYTKKLRYDFDKPINKNDLVVSTKYKKSNKPKDTCDKPKDKQVQKRDTANVFTCPKCNYKAKWKYELNRHLHIGCDVDTIEVYKCTRCSFTTKNHVRLIGHVKLKHNPNPLPHKCTECSFSTKTKKYLTRHQRMQHDPDAAIYMCPDCKYTTKEKRCLSRHISRNHDANAPIYKCASCTFMTTWRCDLVKHFRARHSNSVEMLQCAQCPFTHRLKTVMIKHLRHEHARNQKSVD